MNTNAIDKFDFSNATNNKTTIDEIKEILNKISPSPWKFKPDGTLAGARFEVYDIDNNLLFMSGLAMTNKYYETEIDYEWFLNPEKWNVENDIQEHYYNSKFISNAKLYIEFLLNEIEMLNKSNK